MHHEQVAKSKTNRQTREASTNFSSSRFDEPFERFCKDAGSQPCTCYYPDHPDVAQFELSTDDVTRNASGKNGTGPKTCEDLRLNGHVFDGFYMVTLDTRRVNITYCIFSNTADETNEKITETILKQRGTTSSSPVLRLCAGVGSQPCVFYYSDNPDSPQVERSNNSKNSSKNVSIKPSSCEDLKTIGYKHNGFYLVRFNGAKVKIVYCNFNSSMEKNVKERIKRSGGNQKSSKTVSQLCNGAGSQPCSCYYSKQQTTSLQIELSIDEITKNASSENGMGPSSCEDLQFIGHTIKGFYLIRSNSKKMKIVFCEFKNPLVNETINGDQLDLKPTTGKSFLPNVSSNSDFYSTTTVIELSKKIPGGLTYKEGKSYPLKNELGKCLAVSKLGSKEPSENGAKLIVADCNPSEKGQLWKWNVNNRFCNDWNKCITIYPEWKRVYTDNITQWDNDDGKPFQFWLPGPLIAGIGGSQLANQYGWCLSNAQIISNQVEVSATVELCDVRKKGQLWSFYLY